MKKWKAGLALLLIAALLGTLFAACGTSGGSGQDSGGSPDGGAASGTDSGSAGSDGDDGGSDGETGELAEIEMYFYDLRSTGADYGEHVEEAVNQLTEQQLGIHVNITWLTISDWQQQVQLAISGGEQIDVLPLCVGNGVSALYAAGMLTDLTELLEEYASDALELLRDYTGAYTYDGKLYGLPTLRNYCTNGYIIMRKDVLEELDLLQQAENLTSWGEFEKILDAVSQARSGDGMYALCKSSGYTVLSWDGVAIGSTFDTTQTWDILGDSTLGIVKTDSDGNVSNYRASEQYESELAMVARWYQNGWIYPDSTLVDTHGDELMKQGVSFCTIQSSEYGVETVKGNSYGFEVVCVPYYTGMIMSSTLNSWGIGVPVTSEEPEAACRFINALYTSSELMNLMIWGVEGTDYEVVDGQIKQPESGYYYQADFLIGNNLLLTPLYGNGADYYDECQKIIDTATRSQYLGFAIDTSELDLVMSQISAVNDQYVQSLQCGEYTEAAYDEYLAKLESAGVDDYIAAIQEQLDAWLAAQ